MHDNGAYDKLREDVAEAAFQAHQLGWTTNRQTWQMVADAVLVVVAQRLQELPVSRNDLGTTAWVQWLDIADLFNDSNAR